MEGSNEKQVILKLKPQLNRLKSSYYVKKMALFGSVTRDDFNDQSDIDLLIDFDSDDFTLYLQLIEELESILGRKVDLITFRSLKPRQLEYLEKKLIYV